MTIRSATLAALAGLSVASLAQADGGAIRLSQVRGAYRVTVFTSPVPLSAGPVDISVIVADAADGRPIPDAQVTIRVFPQANPSREISRAATTDAAATKLYQMASFDMNEPGEWSIEVEVDAPLGRATVAASVEVAQPLPRWIDLAGWIALPIVPIALFIARERRRPCS
jgi:hypothetical protein